ncbi:hypothetical protein PX554_03945 [Sphingomonas sp. H39-1-10]|uniref:hypothetical protein n=1 Tax=Sphingomonas TaxID=13687 RepID=UPI000887456A|nr:MULTISPECIES: hypothetical protein [Sphingomonas]MDF0487270.1 hypothetical protein [Sphingomonas pollutisoli]SDA14660.1 hypothetical protein SAMN03159340_00577 [Sphingomonas sp. NFR15]
MNLFAKIALAGIGTAALAGSALAADRAMHMMDVNLPDGSVAHVRYVGDVAPKVVLVPVAQSMPVALFDPIASFASFDQMFADMDRQRDAMLQQVAAMQRAAPTNGKIDRAALNSLPAGGTVSYSFTSYSSGDGKGGGCTQSYQMTSYGAGAQPKVVSQSSGDCGTAPKFGTAPTPVTAPAPEPKTVPHDAV